MKVLLDTNILLRLRDKTSEAFGKVESETRAGSTLVIVPQVLAEYWAVATRPLESNGLGLSLEQTIREVTIFKLRFELIFDNASCFAEWERVVTKYEVKGKQTHDAKLVAAMIAHGIPAILTSNPSDFRRFAEIQILTP